MKFILSLSLIAIATMPARAVLDVAIKVQEVSQVGTDHGPQSNFPTTAVIPLPKGQYQNINQFRIVDPFGATVPTQFEVLDRWWLGDNSIRHLKAHFQVDVPAWNGNTTCQSNCTSGTKVYRLRDDGSGSATGTGLTVQTLGNFIEVNTGPLKFRVNKQNFNVLDEAWLDSNANGLFEPSEQIIQSNAVNGGRLDHTNWSGNVVNYNWDNTLMRLPNDLQTDSSRSDINVLVEEAGPLRVVIRADAQTLFTNTQNHTHGFAVRIYAYAGKPYLKIDYQLQNSTQKNHAGAWQTYSWPLYFDSMNMNFKLNLAPNPTLRFGLGNGQVHQMPAGASTPFLAQERHDQFKIYPGPASRGHGIQARRVH